MHKIITPLLYTCMTMFDEDVKWKWPTGQNLIKVASFRNFLDYK